jgi:hypothetical protein
MRIEFLTDFLAISFMARSSELYVGDSDQEISTSYGA